MPKQLVPGHDYYFRDARFVNNKVYKYWELITMHTHADNIEPQTFDIEYSVSDSESETEYSIIDEEPINLEVTYTIDDNDDDDDEGKNVEDRGDEEEEEDLIEYDDRIFFIGTTRNNPKLCFGGYFYTIDKNYNIEDPPSFMFEGKFYCNGPEAIHWKCENANTTSSSIKCSGRVHTIGFNKFSGYRKEHNHQPNPDRKFVLKIKNQCKSLCGLSNENPITILQKLQVNLPDCAANQMVRLDSIRQVINRIRAKLAYTGPNATSLDTIEIPNALSYTYNGVTFFWDDSRKDDDKRILLFSTKENFKSTKLHGCYFHLCQSLFRNVQVKGLSEYFTKYKSFRDQFYWLQALPFVPEDKVIDAFKLIKSQASINFKPMIKHFESYYIGKLKKGSKTFRDDPRFLISLWSVYKRVIDNLPRTNNSVESWHSLISSDTKKHLSVLKIIEFFRVEEKSVNIRYIQLSAGEVSKRKKKSIIKDERIVNLVRSFNASEMKDYLVNLQRALNSD
ncbi:unnamed protein product [Brachionus calyciflorus]|uniref:FLYWCH-type domain-containing protein n=1 Tax=Brachionus calyciflorus TaxID=104777 RepID=A0A813RSM3_9BILA|nr:unnamed protein product [Brachionus calyciflorus]